MKTIQGLFWCFICCYQWSFAATEQRSRANYKSKADSLAQLGDSLYQNNQDELATKAYDSAAFYYQKAAVNHTALDEWEAYINCVLDLSKLNGIDPILTLSTGIDTLLQYFCPEDYRLAIFHHKLGANYYSAAEPNFKKALAHNHKALKIRRKHLPFNDFQATRSYFNIGLIYHDLQKKSLLPNPMYADSALYFFEKVLSIWHQVEVFPKERIAAAYSRIGQVHHFSQEYPKAYAAYQQVVANWEKANVIDSIELAFYYRQLGVVCEKLGDYQQAIHYYQSAKSIYQLDTDYFKGELAVIYQDLGEIDYRLDMYDTSINYFQKALTLYGELNKNLSHQKEIGGIWINQGTVSDEQKNYSNAILQYQKAIEAYKKLPLSSEITHNLTKVYTNLAITYKHQENYPKALETIQQVIKIRKKSQKNLAGSYENLADIQFLKGNTEIALQSYQQSILCLMPHFTDSNYYENPLLDAKSIIGEPYDLLRVLRLKAETLQYLATQKDTNQNLKAALQCYQKADTLVHQLRQSFQAEQSKYFLAKEVIPLYEGAIGVALQLKQPHLAFQFSEKNKAAVLISLVRQQKGEKFGGELQTLIQKERKLQAKIAQTQLQLYETEIKETGQAQHHTHWDSLARFQREVEKLHQEIKQNHSQYYAFQHAPIDVTIPSLQEHLPPNSAILSFFEGQQNRYNFTITPDTFWVTQQAIDTLFHHSFEDFRNLMDEVEVWNAQKYAESAYQLYQNLLEFPLEKIEEKGGIKQLMIIPDGKLNYLAFEALIRKSLEDMEDLKPIEIPYVLHDYAVGYNYSAQLMQDDFLSNSPSNAHLQFGGWAANENTLISSNNKRIPLDSLWKKKKLANLKYANQEVRAIGGRLKGAVWENATKEDFAQNCMKHNILHLSMHGVVDETQVLNAGLVFAVPEDSSSNLLNIAEIYDLHLQNVDLTVLSACNTAYGQILQGEGIMSLSRAFTYSGCKSLVTSLWSVSDKSTYDIMTAFYKYLEAGENKSIALQKAKLTYMDNAPPSSSSPKSWAGSIVLGDIDSIGGKGRNDKMYWLVLGGCLLLSWFFTEKK